jgi:transketolase
MVLTDDRAGCALDARSKHLRRLIMQALLAAGRGHVGPALSLVEILRVLYDDVLSFRAAEPTWPARDRCILSKGHGCLALYALLVDKGFFPAVELDKFCAIDGILGGHPERDRVPGVEASTGALGHGLSIGIGMALAGRLHRRDYRTFVVMGDGELDEGSVWEGAMMAGKHRLDTLTAIVDYNGLQSYGPIDEVQILAPLEEKFTSFGFAAATVDGHDVAALRHVLAGLPLAAGKPSAVICRTVKGRGIPSAEGNASWHHKSKLSEAELAEIRAALGE